MASIVKLYQQFSNKPFGARLFSRAVCLRAPYFASIHPLITALSPECTEVRIRKRRSVQNHIGTVHAIAICNMAEVAAGLLAEAAVPPSHRWIPKGMTVEYLKKAATDLRAVGRPAAALNMNEPSDFPIEVYAYDTAGEAVFRAVITMWVTRKKTAS